MTNLVLCILGPTASGKTSLAVELLHHFPFEIISVDSALIYKEMDIGTAKPTEKILLKAPHHLINIRDPDQSYSAADFCEDASTLSKKIIEKGKIPLLVGGTMMYFNAMQYGLSTLPKANEKIRSQLLEQAKTQGWGYLHERLKEVDPLSAKRIHPNDTQRIQRALEVYEISGKPLSELMGRNKNVDFEFINVLLIPDDRAWLHARIEERFSQMLVEGFLKEVETLKNKWQLDNSFPSMRTVGYRQAIEFLERKNDFSLFKEKAIAATRQLAKRQITWLRHWPEGFVLKPENENVLQELIALIKQILDNSASPS